MRTSKSPRCLTATGVFKSGQKSWNTKATSDNSFMTKKESSSKEVSLTLKIGLFFMQSQ